MQNFVLRKGLILYDTDEQKEKYIDNLVNFQTFILYAFFFAFQIAQGFFRTFHQLQSSLFFGWNIDLIQDILIDILNICEIHVS